MKVLSLLTRYCYSSYVKVLRIVSYSSGRHVYNLCPVEFTTKVKIKEILVSSHFAAAINNHLLNQSRTQAMLA